MSYEDKTWENGEGNANARLNATALNDLEGRIATEFGLVIPKTLVDVKGDLLVATGADAVARKAAGADGTLLSADSSKSGGLDWVSQLPQAILDAILPWRIDVNVLTPRSLTTGTWGATQSSTILGAGYITNSSNAQNDEVGWDLVLAAGTWDVNLIGARGTARPIATIRVDGTDVGTYDFYNAAGAFDIQANISGISIATTGKKRVSIKAATRNGSASSWALAIQALSLRRTA